MRRPRLRFRAKVRSDREQGTAAVELAIVLPVLVMMIFGIIECGRYYNTTMTVTHASREAVRKVALGSGDPIATGKAAASPLTVSVIPGPSCDATHPATATVTSAFTFNIPFVSTKSGTISSTAVMRCGG
jgi:Flp pilus assembly protein TadG